MVRLSSRKMVGLVSQRFHLIYGSCGTQKNPPQYLKRVGDINPSGVVNLSLAGWVICKDTLKMEPRSVVCSTPYGGSDYKQINIKY